MSESGSETGVKKTKAPRLQGKRVFLTGGSRGLGRAMALEFARAGAKVALTYHRNAEAGEEAALACRGLGVEARAYQASVLDSKATDKVVRELEADWGGIDILVNNAGITQALPFALLDDEDWDLVMDTNVKGVYLTTRSVLRGMIRRKSGVILNIGSLAGVRIIEAPVHYCASKAAVVGFTQGLAKEMARYNIRIFCLAPGVLDGGVGKNLPDYKLADYLKHCALGRLGTFEEAGRFAAFLVSEENPYMSGETIVLDGGL